MSEKKDYDAIIIGAGIGGLVCGCYLAKAGMKVLIVEKNAQPGGYCTSFTRRGFRFDACVHFLGSLREEGIVHETLKYLGILESIKILRNDPSDIIYSDDFKFSFCNNIDITVGELQKRFPGQRKGIKDFFHAITKIEGNDFIKFRYKSFQDILNGYFDDPQLKGLLGFPVLGNMGVPPSQTAAIKALTIYKEFMLDGGYYISSGVQTLPDVLSNKLKSDGGKIALSQSVNKIIIKNNVARGIVTNKGETLTSSWVISDGDAFDTFFNLCGSQYVPDLFRDKLLNMKPSMSMFALYLGLKGRQAQFPSHANVWWLSDYDLDGLYNGVMSGDISDIKWFLGYYNPDEKTVLLFFNVPYISSEYWLKNRNRVMDMLIGKAKKILPNISDVIGYKTTATPDTMMRWTSNRQGAAYGWAGTVEQFAVNGLTQITPIKNLLLTGHWTTLAQGVSGVVYLGASTAKSILNPKL